MLSVPTSDYAPHPWQKPDYGTKTQNALLPDDTNSLNAADKTRILEVLGTLLFYARASDSTLLTAIGKLATEQSEGTKTTMEKLSQLLNYCTSHPDATVRFTASDMILAVESDASYLSVLVKAHSRAAGYFYLLTNTTPASPTDALKPNGAVHILCHIMREVLSSAAEANFGALFHNGKESCPLCIALEKMGHHSQPARTPSIATDNNTASGIANDTVKQKRSKLLACIFIGSAIASARDNSKSIGAKVRPILLITFQNIIQPRIIRPSAPRTFTRPRIRHEIISTVFLMTSLRRVPRPLLQWTLVKVCCYPGEPGETLFRRHTTWHYDQFQCHPNVAHNSYMLNVLNDNRFNTGITYISHKTGVYLY